MTTEDKTKTFQPFYFHITVKLKLHHHCPEIKTTAYNIKKIPGTVSETLLIWIFAIIKIPHTEMQLAVISLQD